MQVAAKVAIVGLAALGFSSVIGFYIDHDVQYELQNQIHAIHTNSILIETYTSSESNPLDVPTKLLHYLARENRERLLYSVELQEWLNLFLLSRIFISIPVNRYSAYWQ